MKRRRERGVAPYPNGRQTSGESIEAGDIREQVGYRNAFSKRAAIQRGRQLRQLLKGRGWQVRVWQNLGWHYSVRRGPIQVRPFIDWVRPRFGWTDQPVVKGYMTFLDDDPKLCLGGASFWTIKGDRSVDPNNAVAKQLQAARRFVDRCTEVIRRAEGKRAGRKCPWCLRRS